MYVAMCVLYVVDIQVYLQKCDIATSLCLVVRCYAL
jgi:hypothetical protein